MAVTVEIVSEKISESETELKLKLNKTRQVTEQTNSLLFQQKENGASTSTGAYVPPHRSL
jgi:hypothetical protein